MRGWRTDRAAPGPSAPSSRSRPLIFGVTSVYDEDDVIWATVRNLFVQGADEVFVDYVRARTANQLAILDHLYDDRYEIVPNYFFAGEARRGVVLRDWRELVPAAERALPDLAAVPATLTAATLGSRPCESCVSGATSEVSSGLPGAGRAPP